MAAGGRECTDNDYVWAGRGADYLMGGAGEDHLAGLAGLGGGDAIDACAGSGEFAINSGASGACWIGAGGRFDSIKAAQNDERQICAA